MPNREDSLAMMRDTALWPARTVLPLAHAERKDEWGSPALAFLAWGHGSTLYFGNVGDLPSMRLGQDAFEAHLTTLASLTFVSFDAVLADGWLVD
jgi:hypothetical protein